MVINSVDLFKQTNTNTFNVSTTGGGTTVDSKYWGKGIVEISLTNLSRSYPVVIKDFPYDFKILKCSLLTTEMTASAATFTVSLWHTSSNAANVICGMAMAASRGLTTHVLLNFNKTSVSKDKKLKLMLQGISGDLCAGTLRMIVKPI